MKEAVKMKKTEKNKKIALVEKSRWMPSDEALIRVLLDASRDDAQLVLPPKAA